MSNFKFHCGADDNSLTKPIHSRKNSSGRAKNYFVRLIHDLLLHLTNEYRK